MELELTRENLNVWEMCGESAVTQEETAETIVPDYCPDIARIITTEGKIFLHSRECRDGKGEISGVVRVTVLYTPDGESGIRMLEFSLPFNAETDGKACPDCTTLWAETETEYLETRILNPRKVFTHCKLVTRVSGYRRTQLSFCTDADAPPELCVEKKREEQHVSLLSQIAEKDFTFTDDLSLPTGREAAAEILSSRVSAAVTETKLIGGKLILKGAFAIQYLYRTQSNGCQSGSGELPFSQILEVGDGCEGMVPSVRLQLTGADIQVNGSADEEGREISVVLYLHATAFLRTERELTLLSDLYSTLYSMSYEVSPLPLTTLSESMTRRQTVRETLEIGVVADTILSLSVTCGGTVSNQENGMTTLRTSVVIRALYQDEGGVPLVAERTADVSCQTELPENSTVTVKALCADAPQGTLSGSGIEARFPIDFQIFAVVRQKKVCLQSAKIASDTPKDLSQMPSLVLRCMGRQETLWDLAKKYNTTMAGIRSANGLEADAVIPTDQLLLIPKKRVSAIPVGGTAK